MLDIEIYRDVLELIHATAGGEGVEILFRILSGHCNGSELPLNTQFPHSLIEARIIIRCTIRGVLSGSHLPASTWANRPVQQGIFLGDSDMVQATSRGQF